MRRWLIWVSANWLTERAGRPEFDFSAIKRRRRRPMRRRRPQPVEGDAPNKLFVYYTSGARRSAPQWHFFDRTSAKPEHENDIKLYATRQIHLSNLKIHALVAFRRAGKIQTCWKFLDFPIYFLNRKKEGNRKRSCNQIENDKWINHWLPHSTHALCRARNLKNAAVLARGAKWRAWNSCTNLFCSNKALSQCFIILCELQIMQKLLCGIPWRAAWPSTHQV